MSNYIYTTTDLVSGVVRADTIPLHVESFGCNMGSVGQPGSFSGSLDLGPVGIGTQSAYLGALEPRKTLLWAIQDGYPIWCGPIWDWPHQSVISNKLPIAAREFGSLFGAREVRADQVIASGTDLFTAFRALLSYTLLKTYGGVAQLNLGTNLSGVTLSAPYTFSSQNLQKVSDALNQFSALYGFEYVFVPGLGPSGSLVINLLLGYPTITRTAPNTNLMFLYPGNVLDYSYPRNGSISANSLLATAPSAAGFTWKSGSTHGQNTAELVAGYPLLEASTSYTASAITLQTQVDAVADNRVAMLSGTVTVPTVKVGGGLVPKAGQIQLGDQAYLSATSTLHPPLADGSPGLQATVRIVGWVVHPPSEAQSESTDYALGGLIT